MKKILCLLMMLIVGIAFPSVAKNEWADQTYNWAQVKSVVFLYDIADEIEDEAAAEDTSILFAEEMQKKLAAKRSRHSFEVVDVFEDRDTAEEAVGDQDLVVRAKLLEYRMGETYREGYYRTVSVPEKTTIKGPDGKTTEITTTRTHQEWVPPAYEPTAYARLRVEGRDAKTDKKVWAYSDDRVKTYDEGFGPSAPRNMYKRMLDDCFAALGKKLK